MRHGVNDSQPDVGESHTRDVLSERHALSAFLRIGDCAAERFGNDFDRFEVEHIRHFPSAFRDIALDCVRERIHARRGRKPLGHRGHHFGIYHCDDGNIVDVHADKFTFLFHIGDDVIDSDLRRGACRRGNRDNGNGRVLGGRYAFQRTHVRKFGIRNDNADRLRRIHRRTAADRDEAIRLALLKRRNARLHVLDRGIGLDVRIQSIRDLGAVQYVEHLFRNAEFYEVGIGANKCFFQPSSRNFPRDLVDRARAVITRLVQNDSCHCFLSPYSLLFFDLFLYFQKNFSVP